MSIQTSTNDTYVQRTATVLDNNTPYTAMFWMKIASNPAAYQQPFQIGGPETYNKVTDSFGTDSDGITARSVVADGTNATATTDGTFPVGTWTHVAIVRISTTQLKVYINGVDAAMDNTQDISARVAPTYMILLCYNAFRLVGLQTDVRYWTSALTQAQIAQEMNSASVINTTNLWAHIPCSGASVTAALTDDSGNANDFSTVIGTGTITVSTDEPMYGASATASITEQSDTVSAAGSVTATGTPVIASINSGSPIVDGAGSVQISGENFDSTLTLTATQAGGLLSISLPVTYISATSASFNPSGGTQQLSFGQFSLRPATTNGGTGAPVSATFLPAVRCQYIILSGLKPNPNRPLLVLPGFTDKVTSGQIEVSGNSTGSKAVPVGALVHGDGTYEFGDQYDGSLWARFYNYDAKQWTAWTWQPGVPPGQPTGGF